MNSLALFQKTSERFISPVDGLKVLGCDTYAEAIFILRASGGYCKVLGPESARMK